MLAKDLLKDIVKIRVPKQIEQLDIKAISVDSRRVQNNSLFIALKGTKCDGADFIQEALDKGAQVIIKSEELAYSINRNNNAGILTVEDTHKALCDILLRFYGKLSDKVKVIGITGTNGKTTVSYLIESILKSAGLRCGVVGTINYRYGDKIFASHNTTPGIVDNQEFLSELMREKIGYCVMEVSSHALDQRRVGLIDFQAAIFTNLTSDHLDYHKDREDYFAAKAKLFQQISPKGIAVINNDDEYSPKLQHLIPAKIFTYGIKNKSDITVEDVTLNLTGSRFTLKSPWGTIKFNTPLIGFHNIYNILAAVTVGLFEGINADLIKRGIEAVGCVPGRLEAINEGQDFHVFVDYAHTEDALKNILQSIRNVCPAKIILVFGCGGDRDKSKRPKMGKTASELADFVMLTTDNPRSEDPKTIVEQIVAGCEKNNYKVILDRKEAIEEALQIAGSGNVVVVAGKGHEDYQIFKDKTIHFDDRQVVRDFLLKRREHSPSIKH